MDDDVLNCPICLSLLDSPFVTGCGHTFCYGCISTHIQSNHNCPCCSAYISKDHIFPNFLLSKVVSKAAPAATAAARSATQLSPYEQVQAAIADDRFRCSAEQIDALVTALQERKASLEEQDAESDMELLLQFLSYTREEKAKRLAVLNDELSCLERDIEAVRTHRFSGNGAISGGGGGVNAGTSAAAAAAAAAAALGAPQDAVGTSGGSNGGGATAAAMEAFGAARGGDGAAGAPSISGSTGRPHGGVGGAAATATGGSVRRQGRSAGGGGGAATGGGGGGGGGTAGLGGGGQGALASLLRGDGGSATSLDGATSSKLAALPGAATAAAGASGVAVAAAAGGAGGAAQPGRRQDDADSDGEMDIDVRRRRQHGAGSHGNVAAAAAAAAAVGGAAANLGSTGPTTDDGFDCCGEEGDDGDELCSPRQRHKRQRINSQFEDLQRCYLQLRARTLGGGGGAAGGGSSLLRNGSSTTGGSGGMLVPGSTPGAAAAAAGAGPAANGDVSGDGQNRMGAGGIADYEGLAEFSRLLSVFTTNSKLEVVGSTRCANTGHATSILSSIEFDRDGELFATGGVSKRISVYNFRDVVAAGPSGPGVGLNGANGSVRAGGGGAGGSSGPGGGGGGGGMPVHEIVTRSKLTSLSWNPYVRSHLISSDYEGVVSLWDVPSAKTVLEYEAHEKRIWSVDFSRADPMAFVSGSDDGWVKVWSTRQPNPVADIDVRANVCCVEYNPRTSHEVAVGSADHQVHVYDLRNLGPGPLRLFSGHRKAVSYVRYASPTEVASASTDGTLRLWDLSLPETAAAAAHNTASAPPSPGGGIGGMGGGGVGGGVGGGAANPVRTFRGHVNEKNFVGMAASGEFLACGSETNEVFVYFKALSAPIARTPFDATVGGVGADGMPPPPPPPPPANDGQFISSVAWQPGTRMLVAANCMGFIKVMRLTG